MAYKTKLKKISGELKKASRLHAGQAKKIDSMLTMKKSPVRGYVSDAQRKAVHASKADGGKGKNFNKVSKNKRARGGAAGGGMTEKGVREYKRKNPGSKLRTAVTGKNPSKKDAARRKSFCARSRSWKSERGLAARRRWRC